LREGDGKPTGPGGKIKDPEGFIVLNERGNHRSPCPNRL
jgi:hypothetical protein